jgi:hypothetical protein
VSGVTGVAGVTGVSGVTGVAGVTGVTGRMEGVEGNGLGYFWRLERAAGRFSTERMSADSILEILVTSP